MEVIGSWIGILAAWVTVIFVVVVLVAGLWYEVKQILNKEHDA